MRLQQRGHVGKTTFGKMKPAIIFGKHWRAAGNRIGITVNGKKSAASGVKNGAAIAAIAKGCIKIATAILRAKRIHHLV